MKDLFYPVPGRSADRNKRICSHEVGHTLVSRAIGDFVHEVSVIPNRNYEGRCTRSGPVSSLTFDDSDTIHVMQPDEVIGICERLEALGGLEIGASRIETAEYYCRGLNNIVVLVSGEACETLLHPDQPSLGAQHDFDEATAFAKITVFASPSVQALIEYARAEAVGIIAANLDIAHALVAALEKSGQLSGEQVDTIIADAIAARAVKAEKIRRNDWKARQRSAATFLEGLSEQSSGNHPQ
jgi:ATP-dependent Zn protease